MSQYYMRKSHLICGNVEIDTDNLYMYFNIPYDDGPDVNIGTIDIYNLSDSTIAMFKKGQTVYLNAGYQNDIGSILIGTLQSHVTAWENVVDKKTTLTVNDSNDNWMGKTVKKTFKKNATAQQILTNILPTTGLKTGALSLPVNKVYKSGKTLNDKVGKCVIDTATDCGAKVHVNKGKIYIRDKSAGDSTTFVLDSDHGLIGTPSEVETTYTLPTKTDDTTGSQVTRKGYKVVSLLNHNFTTDVILKIVSSTANGFFRIESGSHVSDGSNFHTEMEVYPV